MGNDESRSEGQTCLFDKGYLYYELRIHVLPIYEITTHPSQLLCTHTHYERSVIIVVSIQNRGYLSSGTDGTDGTDDGRGNLDTNSNDEVDEVGHLLGGDGERRTGISAGTVLGGGDGGVGTAVDLLVESRVGGGEAREDGANLLCGAVNLSGGLLGDVELEEAGDALGDVGVDEAGQVGNAEVAEDGGETGDVGKGALGDGVAGDLLGGAVGGELGGVNGDLGRVDVGIAGVGSDDALDLLGKAQWVDGDVEVAEGVDELLERAGEVNVARGAQEADGELGEVADIDGELGKVGNGSGALLDFAVVDVELVPGKVWDVGEDTEGNRGQGEGALVERGLGLSGSSNGSAGGDGGEAGGEDGETHLDGLDVKTERV